MNTDASGNFTIPDLVVPGLDLGIHAVVVQVGTGSDRTTASTSFEILPPTVAFTGAGSGGSEATTPANLEVTLSAASGQQETVGLYPLG